MKLRFEPVPLSTCVDTTSPASLRSERSPVVTVFAATPYRPAGSMLNDASPSSSVRMVGVLAFCQSLLFLLLWLFLCAWAGAATVSPAEAEWQLKLSTYAPVQPRDPFERGTPESSVAKPSADTTPELSLQGILFDPRSPAAIVNNHLLSLNNPVNLAVGKGVVAVKAIEISRDRVVLDVAGRTTELRLAASSAETRKPRSPSAR